MPAVYKTNAVHDSCVPCRPVAHFVSWLIPTWPVVQVNRNTMYPDIQAEWDQGTSLYLCLALLSVYANATIQRGRHIFKVSFDVLIA